MHTRRSLRSAPMLVGLSSILFMGVSAAQADISDAVFTIEATNALGTASFTGHLSEGLMHNGSFDWQLPASMSMVNAQGIVIASLASASVRVIDDPEVQVNFSVAAGNLDTVFTITSALLTFPTIAQAQARASGGITLTDVNGGGALLSRVTGDAMYQSAYNGLVPGGTPFAGLMNGEMSADVFSSNSEADASAAAGAYMPIGSASDMSARFRFQLSAGDEASGTSTYQILPIPAPGAAAIFVAGIALMGSRRRV